MRITISLLLLCVLSADVFADWPQWRGPNRSGYIDAVELATKLPSDGLQPEWKLDAFQGGTSGGWSSPVISGNRVFAYSHTKTKMEGADLGKAKYPWLSPDKRVGMSDEEYEEYEIKRRDENEQRAKSYEFDQRLVCLDLETGAVVWDRSEKTIYTRFTQSSTPCVTDGKVLVLTPARIAKCFDAETGEVVWKTKIPGTFRDEYFSSSFAVAGDVALVACGPLVALDLSTGKINWTGDGQTDYQSHSSPILWDADGQLIAICNTSGGITKAYSVASGEKIWSIKSGAGSASPIVAGNLLLTYGSSRKTGLTAFELNPKSPGTPPEESWRFQRAADNGSTPVVRGEHVFVQGEKRVAKVALTDGKPVWQTTLKISTPKYTSMIGAGNQIFYSWEGLIAFDANSDRFEQIYDAEIDSTGRLIKGEDLRRILELDSISAGEDGLAKAEKIWQKEAIQSGPLGCSTPAFSDGRLVIRLRKAIACYDLRQ